MDQRNALDQVDRALGAETTEEHTGPSASDSSEDRIARQIRRTAISRDSVVTADEVIELVGGRAGVVRVWLKNAVIPLRHPTGRVIYRWGDVLQALQRGVIS